MTHNSTRIAPQLFNMNILSIDTTTPITSIAITRDKKLIAEFQFLADRRLSARLIPEIKRLLEIAEIAISDIDVFCASVGPGSFTGVRAGIATIQGLALANKKKCFAVSSLTLLAMNFTMTQHLVCILLDARKSEVYGALFECSKTFPTKLINDSVMSPETFIDLVLAKTDKPVIFAGEGIVRYHDLILSKMGVNALFSPFPHNVHHAAFSAFLAIEENAICNNLIEPAELLPKYLRASEAEYAKLSTCTIKNSCGIIGY